LKKDAICHSQKKVFDGNMIKRTNKSSASYIFEAEYQDNNRSKSKSRNSPIRDFQNMNTKRTIFPDKDITAKDSFLTRRSNTAINIKKSQDNKIKSLLSQSAVNLAPEMNNYKRKQNPTFTSSILLKTTKSSQPSFLSRNERKRMSQTVDNVRDGFAGSSYAKK